MAGFVDVGVAGRRIVVRWPPSWAVGALAGGMVVAACFALWSPRPSNDGRLSLAEERAVLAALGDAQVTWKAAQAYFNTLEDEDSEGDPDGTPLDPEHAEEVETLIKEVISERLGAELNGDRLRSVERHLAPILSRVALFATIFPAY